MASIPRRRILIVEDSPASRNALADLLEPLGFDVDQAEHGAEALRVLEGGAFDLIFLDLGLPVVDGVTLLRILRGRGDTTPVVMVTASSQPRALSGALKFGVSEYLPKPVGPEAIRAVVARILGVPATAVKPETPRALVVDAEEAVAREVRPAMPAFVETDWAPPARAEELLARQAYRVVLVDASGPREDSNALGRRIRELQPEAGAFAMYPGAATWLLHPEDPFDAAVPRPPPPELVRGLLCQTAVRPTVLFERGCLVLAPFTGAPAHERAYFSIAGRRLREALAPLRETVAGVVVDLSRAPARTMAVEAIVKELVPVTDGLDCHPVFVVPPVAKASLDRLELRAVITAG
jgi:two-component system response regulator TctD